VAYIGVQEDGLHLTTAAQAWLGRELAHHFLDIMRADAREAGLL
jgi:hypothetical protein